MDANRKGEIARACLKNYLKEEGFAVDQHFRRRVGNVAKNTNLPFAEVLEFSTEIAGEILAEVSDPKKAPTPEELEGFHGQGGH